MKLIVGLGNPGKKYERTRHNVGFVVLDALYEKLSTYGINQWELSKKFNAQISGCTINADKIVLCKPMTYMNNSGESIGIIMNFYKLTHKDLIVVHDDKDILLGESKIQTDRGDAGHNGIKSIISHIGTKDFTRMRIGIASTNKKKMADIPTFVLNKFGILEKKKIETVIDDAITELLRLIS
ncbi:MAG TPA: aminoacyl-tRNA hydrolase [Candidatus Magasanikbacteria bacterium]|nr:MAG: aminoacyl-tRNA hydrolase [Candidatus Magasanikbacteria bacterium RIFOXYC2_FULL_39_8]HAT03693.1 aminoacyl-tRNA hydrolase [Candidatus Magasanikbacteria bacterium]